MPRRKPIKGDFRKENRLNSEEDDERETILLMVGPVLVMLPNPLYKRKENKKKNKEGKDDV